MPLHDRYVTHPSHTNCLDHGHLRCGLRTQSLSSSTEWYVDCVYGWHAGGLPFYTEGTLAALNVLARGASNAMWHSGCLAPDRCVESICDWLIRGPLFCAHGKRCRGAAAQLRNLADSDCTHAVLRRLDEIAPNRPDRCLRAVRHANLAQYVLDMLFHRLIADAKRLSDFLVRESKSKLLQNLAFALCQRDLGIGR